MYYYEPQYIVILLLQENYWAEKYEKLLQSWAKKLEKIENSAKRRYGIRHMFSNLA